MQTINKLVRTQLKAKLPLKLKIYLRYQLSKKSEISISKDTAKVIVALAADYGNLGDVAITNAQINFIRDAFPNHQILPIYLDEINSLLIPLKKRLNPDDVITIIGGGNMGDLYEGFEEYRRSIIKFFPNNKIVSFPQTIDFSETDEGTTSIRKSIKVYSGHKNLHIFAREPQSYEKMKTCFKDNKVYIVPDIVLYLNKIEPKLNRNGIIFSLRDDSEKKISNNKQKQLIDSVIKTYTDVKFLDTHIGDHNFAKEMGDAELDNILNSFKSSKVVITDRLHGMIFCAITKTPCVVLPNSNHKISGTYNYWLSDLPYIQFVEEFEETKILNVINHLHEMDLDQCKSLELDSKYIPLLEALRN